MYKNREREQVSTGVVSFGLRSHNQLKCIFFFNGQTVFKVSQRVPPYIAYNKSCNSMIVKCFRIDIFRRVG
jgi:hypothetical protein